MVDTSETQPTVIDNGSMADEVRGPELQSICWEIHEVRLKYLQLSVAGSSAATAARLRRKRPKDTEES